MINSLRVILADFKSGQNLESYLIIAIALTVAVLDVFDLSQQNWVSGAILAVLALLAYSKIHSSRTLEEVSSSLRSIKAGHIFEKSTEVDVLQVNKRIQSAHTIDWVAFTHQKTISIYRAYITTCLSRGGRIRILLMNPNDDTPNVLAKNSYAKLNDSGKFYERGVNYTVNVCEQLSQEIPQGSIEVRFLSGYPPYRMTIYNREHNHGFIRIHLPKAPTSPDAATIAWFRDNNPIWFQFFVEQYELLWKNSKPASVTGVHGQVDKILPR